MALLESSYGQLRSRGMIAHESFWSCSFCSSTSLGQVFLPRRQLPRTPRSRLKARHSPKALSTKRRGGDHERGDGRLYPDQLERKSDNAHKGDLEEAKKVDPKYEIFENEDMKVRDARRHCGGARGYPRERSFRRETFRGLVSNSPTHS